MSTKLAGHSQRPRPAVYWAILELATLADGWLDREIAATVCGCRGQIMSEIRRALTAFTDASAGRQCTRQIARIRTSLDHAETGFMLLRSQAPRMVADALRRIDQILATLDRLEKLDVSEWLSVELVQLATAEPDRLERDSVVTAPRGLAPTRLPQTVDRNSGPDPRLNDAQAPLPVERRSIKGSK